MAANKVRGRLEVRSELIEKGKRSLFSSLMRTDFGADSDKWCFGSLWCIQWETTAGFMELFSRDLRQCLLQMDPTLEFSLRFLLTRNGDTCLGSQLDPRSFYSVFFRQGNYILPDLTNLTFFIVLHF